jgi:hypothetical protein
MFQSREQLALVHWEEHRRLCILEVQVESAQISLLILRRNEVEDTYVFGISLSTRSVADIWTECNAVIAQLVRTREVYTSRCCTSTTDDFDIETVWIELWSSKRTVLEIVHVAMESYQFGANHVGASLDVAGDLDCVAVVVVHGDLVRPKVFDWVEAGLVNLEEGDLLCWNALVWEGTHVLYLVSEHTHNHGGRGSGGRRGLGLDACGRVVSSSVLLWRRLGLVL